MRRRLGPNGLDGKAIVSCRKAIGHVGRCPVNGHGLGAIATSRLRTFVSFLDCNKAGPSKAASGPVDGKCVLLFSTILRGSFHFTMFPGGLVAFGPVRCIGLENEGRRASVFSSDRRSATDVPAVARRRFRGLRRFLGTGSGPTLLPIRVTCCAKLHVKRIYNLA